MTRNRSDAAPDGATDKESAGARPAAMPDGGQVAAYLRAHPGFLVDHPDLLDVLDPPACNGGNGVVDLGQAMVERLRRDVAEMAAARDAVVEAGRGNLTAQARVHKAVLMLLAAQSFEHFIETLTTDLAVILDLDVVMVGVERHADEITRTQTPGVTRLAPEQVDNLMGPAQNVVLRGGAAGDPSLFGAGAGLVTSFALLRLSISSATPPAVLALGSRRVDHFHSGQGTELLLFLARVVENCVRGWLNLPE